MPRTPNSQPSTIRLNKYLAEAGLGSRRKVEELIVSGKVKVNDQTVTNLSTNIDSGKDTVIVNNQPAKIEKKVYIALNKPTGYLTTVTDERGRETILDLVKVEQRIFPVGRLDKNSRGLLVLTNDGDFANKILHPKHKIKKIYEVQVNKKLTKNDLNEFQTGINIQEPRTPNSEPRTYKTAPAHIVFKKTLPAPPYPKPVYQVTLSEGRKRQIRRMFDVLGYKVQDLKRVQIGSLKLGSLKEGHWRYISSSSLRGGQKGRRGNLNIKDTKRYADNN